jgi:hypothetical protein
MAAVRSPVELVELPFTFTQRRALTATEFAREAGERGVQLSARSLEALHRLGLLRPVLRFRRDGRQIASLARQRSVYASQVAHWDPTSHRDLAHAHGEGRLFDPAAEAFMSAAGTSRRVAGLEYRSSVYLYSRYQLLRLPTIRQALARLSFASSGRPVLDTHRPWAEFARRGDDAFRAVLVAASALEPIYYPQIIGTLTFPDDESFARYDRWRRGLRLTATIRWLGVDASWVREQASQLLREADQIDPLAAWIDLVREADPGQWQRLRGAARNAIDIRLTAEILLRHYEHLAAGRRARPLAGPDRTRRDEYASRLRPRGGIDRTLTAYGLSPHPSLLMVVEGATELLLVPRLMAMLGVRTDPEFIALHDREGVTKNLSALIAYAVAPRVERDEGGRYLRLERPLTRVLVVNDAEGPMATTAQRERRRRAWVDRMLRTLPRQERTPAVVDSIGRLVFVDTWRRNGASFELAHFTDRQLAAAILAVNPRVRRCGLAGTTTAVGNVRATRGNLDSVLGQASKVELADALWPVLERKVERARRLGTAERIPIVRIVNRAVDLARELPRRNVVIPLDARRRRR